METKSVEVKNGEYHCTIDISTEEWKSILLDGLLMNDNYRNVLMKFYNEPGHKSTCKALGEKYHTSPQTFNGTILSFAKAVQKKINRFEVIGTDGNLSYWIIPMLGKYSGPHFEWTLRPELVAAIEELNIKEKHFLQEIYETAINENHWVFYDWFPSYKKFVLEYKEQAGDIKWDDRIFQRLVKDTTNNGISDLRQKNFTWDEFGQIKDNWNEIQPIIKTISDANTISTEEYNKLLAYFRKYTSENRPAASNRVIAAFLPNFVTTVVKYDFLRAIIFELKKRLDDYPDLEGDWLKDNINFIQYCNSNICFKDPWHSSVFAWYLKEYFDSKTREIIISDKTHMNYINLLKKNLNLILTGAPGTGKTYLAKRIAEAMDAETEFVQFHPSYDYTDFVEGLRPVRKDDAEIGFELKDGIFKSFCKKAAKNLIDSAKSKEELLKQKSLSDNLSLFIEKIENEISEKGKFILYGIGGKECAPIIDIDTNSFVTKSINGNTLSTSIRSILTMFETYSIYKDFNWTFKDITEKLSVTHHHTYYFGFLKAFDAFLKESKAEAIDIDPVERKNFVFIIDEINRAEVSKVFGELFFSLDPGYRGEKWKVKTQYANLQLDDDIFKEGFYIPDNVYIIGTMNDIDRSVESFDFAMRRRFAWKEIKAIERISMWDDNIEDFKDEALKRMNALNTHIESIQGLNSSYHIGPAYFLKISKYNGDFDELWNNHLEGVITEYLRGLPDSTKLLKSLKAIYNNAVEQMVDAENN